MPAAWRRANNQALDTHTQVVATKPDVMWVLWPGRRHSQVTAQLSIEVTLTTYVASMSLGGEREAERVALQPPTVGGLSALGREVLSSSTSSASSHPPELAADVAAPAGPSARLAARERQLRERL